MDEIAKRGGIVLRVDGALFFVPVSVALGIAAMPRVTAVPGGPPDLVGVAMLEGAIVPVVSIGPARAEMVVCQYAGEPVGLVGAEVITTGVFDAAPERSDAIVHGGQRVEALDVAAICARVEARARPGRWGG